MDGIKRFFNQAIMSYKSLFSMLNIENYILVKTLMPLFQMIFFVLIAKFAYKAVDLTPWVVGNSLILVSFNAFFGVSNSFISDRAMGTLKVIIASPINKFVIFFGRTFMHIIDGFISVFLGLIVGLLLFNIDLTRVNIPLFLLTIVIGVFSVMGLGILIGIFALLTTEIHMLLNISYSLLLIFSGANIPKENLPVSLQFISNILPLSRSIAAMNHLINGNNKVGSLLIEELFIGSIYILISFLLYHFLERLAKKGASIDVY